MAADRPEFDTEEFIQYKLEKQIREQYELHGWGVAVHAINPLEILIMVEEEEIDETDFQINITRVRRTKS